MNLELQNATLFDSLLEISVNDHYIDLHNDFECIGINCLQDKIDFEFISNQRTKTKKWVSVMFYDIEIIKIKIDLRSVKEGITLDNFHRGRISAGDHLIDELSNGKRCFYMEFTEGQYFEILASKVVLELYSG